LTSSPRFCFLLNIAVSPCSFEAACFPSAFDRVSDPSRLQGNPRADAFPILAA
jgi:hypothetical protein